MACSALLLAQCNAPAIKSNIASFDRPPDLTHVDPSFRLGAAILSGFDAPGTDDTWQPDDWVLLGVKVAHGDAEDVWFIRIQTLPPEAGGDGSPDSQTYRKYSVPFSAGSVRQGTTFTLPTGRIRLETYDRNGEFIQSSIRYIPREIPTTSVFETCGKLLALSLSTGTDERAAGEFSANGLTSRLSAASQSDAAVQARISGDGLVTLITTLRTLGAARALKPVRDAIRQHVIKEPGMLGLLLNGLRLTMKADFTGGEVLTTPWTSEVALTPRYRVQSPVLLAGQRLFDCMLVVCPPLPPYHLTSGILTFEAAHPDKPENRLTVQVLAARRMQDAEQPDAADESVADAR